MTLGSLQDPRVLTTVFRALLLVLTTLIAALLGGGGVAGAVGTGAVLRRLVLFLPAWILLTLVLLLVELPGRRPRWQGLTWAWVFAATALALLGNFPAEGGQRDLVGYFLLGGVVATSRNPLAGGLVGVMAGLAFALLTLRQGGELVTVGVLSQVGILLTAGLFTGLLGREADVEREVQAEALAELRRELAELGEHLKNVLSCVASGVLVIDGEGKIATYNRAAERILGVPAHQALGRPLTEAGQLQSLGEVFERGPTPPGDSSAGPLGSRQDVLFRRPDGMDVRLGFEITPLEDLAARRLGQIMVFQDVTQLRDLEQRMQAQDKLASLGRLVSGIAHEFGNLLGGARGHVDIALLGDSADVREALPIVRETLDRALKTIEHLLHFARGAPLDPGHEVSLEQVVERALILLKVQLAEAGLEVAVEAAGELPRIRADEAQLEQVLVNLLLNAVHALEAPGLERRQLQVTLGAPPGAVSLAVEDSGPGVPEELRSKVFEPFFTTKGSLGGSTTPGTGLGLATSLGVIEAHRGRLRVDQSPSLGGARFTIYLPRDPSQELGVPWESDIARDGRRGETERIRRGEPVTPPSGAGAPPAP